MQGAICGWQKTIFNKFCGKVETVKPSSVGGSSFTILRRRGEI